MQHSVWMTEIFGFASPTLMNRDCAGPWSLHGTSCHELWSAVWLCCPKLHSNLWCLHSQGKAPLWLDNPGMGEPWCCSVRNAHLGWPRIVLGDDSRGWEWGSCCPTPPRAVILFKIKSVYWIPAVGALDYRSNMMTLSQLYLELRIANAKR